MRLPIGLALVAIGIVLLVFGIKESDSLASDISEFFTGNPTDRAVWLLIGGIAGIIGGLAMAFVPGRALARR